MAIQMMKNIFAALVLGALAAACSPAMTPADGGDGGVMDVPTVVLRDVADRDGGGLFARCTTNAQCGPGIRCDTAYPGGLCVKTCRRDADCGELGLCTGTGANAVCRPMCQPGADDCGPYSGLCFFFNADMQDRRACYPSCYETPPAGTPACVTGTTCNPWSGDCESRVMVTGADNGDACAANGDCKSGRCNEELTDTPVPGTGTGNLGGRCLSVARRPDQMSYMRGMGLLRGNCPMGSVIIPYTGETTGDVSTCVKECVMDMDCRAGYFCNRVFNGNPPAPVYTTGGCVPVNCILAGRTCPGGTRCDRRGNGASAFGVCVRDGDAGGPDGGVDASADVVTDVPNGPDVVDSGAVVDAADAADAANAVMDATADGE